MRANQASVSHTCFRFVDSVMHFKPDELNVLLRSIPAKPVGTFPHTCPYGMTTRPMSMCYSLMPADISADACDRSRGGSSLRWWSLAVAGCGRVGSKHL